MRVSSLHHYLEGEYCCNLESTLVNIQFRSKLLNIDNMHI